MSRAAVNTSQNTRNTRGPPPFAALVRDPQHIYVPPKPAKPSQQRQRQYIVVPSIRRNRTSSSTTCWLSIAACGVILFIIAMIIMLIAIFNKPYTNIH